VISALGYADKDTNAPLSRDSLHGPSAKDLYIYYPKEFKRTRNFAIVNTEISA
jgi:hypothetical protein